MNPKPQAQRERGCPALGSLISPCFLSQRWVNLRKEGRGLPEISRCGSVAQILKCVRRNSYSHSIVQKAQYDQVPGCWWSNLGPQGGLA